MLQTSQRQSTQCSFDVLIDPPFKDAREYARTLSTVKDILSLDPSATIMVWIPQLSSTQEPENLVKAASWKGMDVLLHYGERRRVVWEHGRGGECSLVSKRTSTR